MNFSMYRPQNAKIRITKPSALNKVIYVIVPCFMVKIVYAHKITVLLG